MEKWQRDGYDSFGAWRRADQKRRDDAKKAARADAKKAARADAAAGAATAPPLPLPPQPVVLAIPIPKDVQDVTVRQSCPGPTCSAYGTLHSHQKRVRVAKVPIASVVRQLATPVAATSVTLTDPDVASPPRRQLGISYERVEVTPGGSRIHTLERTTPRGSMLTASYTSPTRYPGYLSPNASHRYTASGASWWSQLNLSDASRAAAARGKRKAGIPPALHAQRVQRKRSPPSPPPAAEVEAECDCGDRCVWRV